MTGASSIPTVSILRQALDVIRREALRSKVETGGVLIGSRSKDGDGSFLVTHATPPGPRARHGSHFFERDVEYQQEILDDLSLRYGVQYLGEWHKHPRNYPVPSPGDLLGVRELLGDPSYGVDEILFPIVICEKDLGFLLHPFFVRDCGPATDFVTMRWHELPMSIEPDGVFSDPSSVSGVDEGEPCARVTPDPSSTWKNWFQVLPFSSGPTAPVSARSTAGLATEALPQEEVVKPDQWYRCPSGRERLGEEQRLLRSFGLIAQPFTTTEDNLCFSFARAGGREIVLVCPASFPEMAPKLLLRDAPITKHRVVRGLNWMIGSRLVDLVVPLLGPAFSKQGRQGAVIGHGSGPPLARINELDSGAAPGAYEP